MADEIVMCPACDGYGWTEDEEDGATLDCGWCDGAGYVYRSAQGIDRKIPAAEYGKVADTLEKLEQERLRAMGYSGTAKKPWEQDIRKRD